MGRLACVSGASLSWQGDDMPGCRGAGSYATAQNERSSGFSWTMRHLKCRRFHFCDTVSRGRHGDAWVLASGTSVRTTTSLIDRRSSLLHHHRVSLALDHLSRVQPRQPSLIESAPPQVSVLRERAQRPIRRHDLQAFTLTKHCRTSGADTSTMDGVATQSTAQSENLTWQQRQLYNEVLQHYEQQLSFERGEQKRSA